ncbi:asparagine synthase (glutamine-hydrolyzing) [Echinicola marina]|uniref:asparagine synthase (glutamine-hydrolyzing) n=1 Tax=Echinicola marina TaxID=2859768 RepID=UPI001CF6EDFE|nr:asparagine synthase (glutamine-hydrolyzing) [Echinicola marina]UCS94380.1 asparagine synthase (glutamine-hydrolyzing) [Echinicola marina]
MCGIYMTNIPYEKEKIRDKLEKINFRGPDNLGIEKINNISLGHLRLSIIDLNVRSNQPYNFKNYYITYNGEIYNFKSIRDELITLGFSFETSSDTEVLIKGYSVWGKDLLDKLNGMFAFAIYDIEREEIFCARDRLGVKPFYYYWENGVFEICSQLSPLIEKKAKISEEAISIYLDYGYVPSPYSILENTYKLSPGNYMIIDLKKKTKTISKYWDLKSIETRDISYEQAKEELHELLKDAIKIRMQSDVPLGVFLSGGIDSSLVAAIASKLSEKPINTFTIGFEDPKYDESKIAQQFAEIIGSDHRNSICRVEDVLNMLPTLIKAYDEPFSDNSALPSLLLSSETKRYATVALSGDGGDESFLGYTHFDLLYKFNQIKIIPLFVRKILGRFPWHRLFKRRPETIKGMLGAKSSDDFSWNLFMRNDSLQKERKFLWEKYYNGYKVWAKSSIQRMADLNIKLWLENDSNVKVDRASMAFSLEVRSPFLDYRIVEFARTLPVKYRYDGKIRKKIIRDILSNYIPEEVFDQPKRGFIVPMDKWLTSELRQDVVEKLNDDFLKKIPNLNVAKFKNKMNLLLDGKYDYSHLVWRLYVLALWYKEYDSRS